MGENAQTESERIQFTPEVNKIIPNPILIFGQGPVIDRETKTKPIKGFTPLGKETINFWGENLAKAAAAMYKRNNEQQIIVMGGRTGGEDYESESNLIAKQLLALGVPETAIKNESLSSDTISNLLMLDKMMREGVIKGKSFDIMGAPFHVGRIKLLMQLLDIPFSNALSSDEVLRFEARIKGDNDGLSDIERRLQMNNDDYFSQKKGEERKTYREKMVAEDIMIREVLERPECWIARIAEIDDLTKRNELMTKLDEFYSNEERDGKIVQTESMFKTRLKIDLKKDPPEQIRSKLSQIKTVLSDAERNEWQRQVQNEGWPKITMHRLNLLVAKRQPRASLT